MLKKVLLICLSLVVVFISSINIPINAEVISTTNQETTTEEVSIENTEENEVVETQQIEENPAENNEDFPLGQVGTTEEAQENEESEETFEEEVKEEVEIKEDSEELTETEEEITEEENETVDLMQQQIDEINALFAEENSKEYTIDDISRIVSGRVYPFYNSMLRAAIAHEENTAKAILTNFNYVGVYSGTAPFDNDDNAGNDSSMYNNVIRSYDKVVYRTSYATISSEPLKEVKNAKFYFKAELEADESVASWDLSGMTWLINPEINVIDGKQVLTGYVSLVNQKVAPRVGTINWVVSVNGANNNEVIKAPKFTMWVDSEDNIKEFQSDSDLIVSARTYIDSKIVYNQENLWGVDVILVANAPSKGFKGQLIPDVNTPITITITTDYEQKLVDYKLNNKNETGKHNIILDTDYSKYTPYDDGATTKETRFNTVYNGGEISTSNVGSTTFTFTISNFELDPQYPTKFVTHNAGKNNPNEGADYDSDVSSFVSFVFKTEEPKNADGKTVSATINNLTATSKDNQIVNDYISNNNVSSYGITGSMSGGDPGVPTGIGINRSGLRKYPSYELISNGSHRDTMFGKIYPGEMVVAETNTMYFDKHTEVNGLTTYVWSFYKFNGDQFEFIEDGKVIKPGYINEVYYVTRANGTTWTSVEEMLETNPIENINDYELWTSADEAIASGHKPLGIYQKQTINAQLQGVHYNEAYYSMPFRVRGNATIDSNTNAVIAGSDLRRNATVVADHKIYSRNGGYSNRYTTSQTGTVIDGYDHWRRTIYYDYTIGLFDDNGNLTRVPSSTANTNTRRGPLSGTTSFIEAWNTYINKNIAQNITSGLLNVEKEVFNLDQNQREIDFLIQAGTTGNEVVAYNEDVITIKEIIPSSLNPINPNGKTVEERWGIGYGGTVIQDNSTNGGAGVKFENSASSLLESETYKDVMKATEGWRNNVESKYSAIEEKDGSRNTIITWTIENYPISYALPLIHYKAIIGTPDNEATDVINGARIQTETSISSQKAPIENKKSVGFTPIKIGGATLSKIALPSLRKENDPLGFEIQFLNSSLSNNSIETDAIMLDILPYNDGVLNKGLDLKDYFLSNIKLEGKLTDGNILDNNLPKFTIYYTLENPETVSNDTKDIITVKADGTGELYDFNEKSYWNSIEVDLEEVNDTYNLTSARISKAINELSNKKITAIAIKTLNIGGDSTYKLSFEYDWNDKAVKEEIERNTVVYNTAELNAGRNIFQKTSTSASSFPHTDKEIIKINEKTSTKINGLNGETVRDFDEITYRINYVNNSNNSATVKIKDKIPTGTKYVNNSATRSGELNSENELEWIITDVPVGGMGSVEFKVIVEKDDEVKEIVNQAEYVVIENGSTQNLDWNKTTIIKNPKPILKAVKSSNPEAKTLVKKGDVITYYIEISNIGLANSEEVIVKDKIPAGTQFVSVMSDYEGTYNSKDNQVEFKIKTVKPEEKIKLEFSVKVVKEDDGTTIKNVATYQEKIPNKPPVDTPTNEVEHPTPKTENPPKPPVNNPPAPEIRIFSVPNTGLNTYRGVFIGVLIISILGLVFVNRNNFKKK